MISSSRIAFLWLHPQFRTWNKRRGDRRTYSMCNHNPMFRPTPCAPYLRFFINGVIGSQTLSFFNLNRIYHAQRRATLMKLSLPPSLMDFRPMSISCSTFILHILSTDAEATHPFAIISVLPLTQKLPRMPVASLTSISQCEMKSSFEVPNV